MSLCVVSIIMLLYRNDLHSMVVSRVFWEQGDGEEEVRSDSGSLTVGVKIAISGLSFTIGLLFVLMTAGEHHSDNLPLIDA